MHNHLSGFNNSLDPNDPHDALIIEQHENYQEFLNRVIAYRNSIDGDFHDDYALNSQMILSSVGLPPSILASRKWDNQERGWLIHDALIETYKHFNLVVSAEQASAIADPEQLNDSERITFKGVGVSFSDAFNFHTELLIQQKPFHKTFMLFFRLKIAGLEILDIPDFLSYQLDESYKANIKTFGSFLKLMLRQDRSELDPILSEDMRITVEEWLDERVSHKPTTASAESNDDNDEKPKLILIELASNGYDKSAFTAFWDQLELDLLKSRKSTVINDRVLKELKDAGFTIPKSGPVFILSLKKNERGIVGRALQNLFKQNVDYRIPKPTYVAYIKGWLQDFKDSPNKSVERLMHDPLKNKTNKTKR